MNYFLSLLLVFAFVASAAGAATPRDIPLPPRLVISSATEKPVTLEGVKIATDIRGSLAVTSVEMRFFNPNARQLEGELQFPLLDGQRVIGMAMDVNGKLRDAVPVDKTRGQEVFEEVTRAQIDPALLQVTQGNNYKLRVFPILPGAYKTVVIRYMESLRGERQPSRLPAAARYAERLAAFDLTITVTEKPAQQLRGTDSVGELAFERSGRFYTARVTREKFAARGVLELAVPSADRAQVYTQVHDGRTYFYAEVPVTGAVAARALPRSVGLIWDASGSGAQRDHARELALLEAYFQKVRNVEVRLTKVRDAAEPAESFSVRGGDWRALRRSLESTVYDGATNFGAFVAEPKSSIQEYLLFTDGLRNFGSGDLPARSGLRDLLVDAKRSRVARTGRAQKRRPLLEPRLGYAGRCREAALVARDAPRVARQPRRIASRRRVALSGKRLDTGRGRDHGRASPVAARHRRPARPRAWSMSRSVPTPSKVRSQR